MKYVENIPFEEAPRELIEQLNCCEFTYNDYLKVCSLYDALPTYWNFAVVDDDDEIIAFVWGILDPLDRFVHAIRGSILPEVRKDSDEVFVYMMQTIREMSKMMGAIRAFSITDKPEIFLRKPIDIFKQTKCVVLEVAVNETLH